MKTVQDLHIKQASIALFGSGNSVNEITKEEFAFIKSRCFVITINYAPVKLSGHLNMWSDLKVSEFLDEFYKRQPKTNLLLAQKNKVPENLSSKVDYWFNANKDKLYGNYTIVWALQLLQRYFPQKQILLFGVDMYNESPSEKKWYDRFTDFDQRKRGKQYNIKLKLHQCAKQIKRYCKKEKVINCNPKSQLDFFEKRDWKKILGLKILHLCATPLAGAPSHLSKVINKYSNGQSISVLKGDFVSSRLKNLKWDYDIKQPSASKLKDLINWADIIQHHRKIYPANTGNKKSLIQYHSPPNGYKPGKTHSKFNGRKLVIAQYHPRFYTDAFLVPNLIDIWDTQYLPGKKANQEIKIFFSWATEVIGGWSDKGSKPTREILERIKAKYGNKVKIKILNNRPYEECMREKRTAHICIDECVTGSYHLQSLEGCSVGAVTFNNIDKKTHSFIAEVTQQPSHPFVKTGLNQLFEKLCFYIEHPKQLKEKGKASRKWMETHWDPKKLVSRFMKVYFDVFFHNTIKKEIPLIASNTSAPKTDARIHSTAKPTSTKTRIQKTEIVGKSSDKTHSITALHKKFAGQDIYIFGTGPSLFDAEPEAFKDKLCFGINYAFEVMPYIDYTFVHVIETYDAIRKVFPNEKLVLPESLVRQWYKERKKNITPVRIEAQNEKAYIYPIQNPYERNLNNKHVRINRETQIFTWSTTTHSAIHLAAYCGAKNIFLIGVDYKLYPNGQVHFESRYSPIYGAQNWNANKKHRQGDEWLEKELAKLGVNLKNLSLVDSLYSAN